MWTNKNNKENTCLIAGSTYMNFRSGEPNNAGGDEDCANMWEDGGWNDAMCDSADRQFQYLCEIEGKRLLSAVLFNFPSSFCLLWNTNQPAQGVRPEFSMDLFHADLILTF